MENTNMTYLANLNNIRTVDFMVCDSETVLYLWSTPNYSRRYVGFSSE